MPEPGMSEKGNVGDEAAPPADDSIRGDPSPPSTGRAGILIVDDKEGILPVLEGLLEDLGQDIVTATSGTRALPGLLDREFAVVLLDVRMPGMDGFETAELIRKRRRSRH